MVFVTCPELVGCETTTEIVLEISESREEGLAVLSLLGSLSLLFCVALAVGSTFACEVRLSGDVVAVSVVLNTTEEVPSTVLASTFICVHNGVVGSGASLIMPSRVSVV